jgi:hypothetical protein
MMLDPQADPGRRAWLPCPYCRDNAWLYLLDFDINLVWVQCGNPFPFSGRGGAGRRRRGSAGPAHLARWSGTLSGGRRGSHPPAPTDPGVTVSRYPALVILVIRQWGAC